LNDVQIATAGTRAIAALLLVLAFASEGMGTVRAASSDAIYAGGTLRIFAGASSPVAGSIGVSDEYLLAFTAGEGPFAGRMASIPYARITRLTHGQSRPRRGAGIAYTVLAAPAGVLELLFRSRRHYVTVAYEDHDGIEQVAVFDMDKDVARAMLAALEARLGRRVVR
jgi:hypothetical protein